MRIIVRYSNLCLLMLVVLSAVQAQYSLSIFSLDSAIKDCAAYFNERLPAGAKVAVLPFESPAGRLSDYVFEEMWGHFEDSGKFVMVDRRNLDRIEDEIKFQLGSGRVDDSTAVSITKQYGAEILVYGQIVSIGNEYRMTVYATDVEKAASSQRSFIIRPDSRLVSLLNNSLEEDVDRAVSSLANVLQQRITIAVGRISYDNTQTVSSFSAWLKNRIIAGAQKQRDKFLVASESESTEFAVLSRGFAEDALVDDSPIQAVIRGNYSPLDKGAQVSLYLVSTRGNKVVLASAQFTASASELERRGLLLLPEKDNAAISLPEFQAKHEVVDPYEGENNEWTFTITPDVLDGIYHDGDFMYMCIYSERDCYFRIIHIDVNGNTQVIYPVSPRDNNFIKAGESRRLPDNNLYKLGPPYGEEIILAAAYDKKFEYKKPSAIAPLSAEIITRSFTVESESEDKTPMSPLATAKFSYTILEK